MIVTASSSEVGIIETSIELLSGESPTQIMVTAFTTSSMQAVQILTREAQLRGPRGQAAGAPFEWTQSIPLDTWTIPHNLNRHPSVTVVDTTGFKVEPDVLYVDTNIIQIIHGAPSAGKAFLN